MFHLINKTIIFVGFTASQQAKPYTDFAQLC